MIDCHHCRKPSDEFEGLYLPDGEYVELCPECARHFAGESDWADTTDN